MLRCLRHAPGTVLCLLLSLSAAAQEAPVPVTRAIRMVASGPLVGTLALPEIGPPAGLVLLLPDSLGHDPRGTPYVDQLLRVGLAALDLQSGGENAEIVMRHMPGLLAEAGAAGLPVGVIGFGAGARAGLRLGPNIGARVLLYPGCADLATPELPHAAPTLLLHGDADPANPRAACAAFAARLAGGAPVRHFMYRKAGYAWDYPAYGVDHRILLPRPDGQGTARSEPWPELAASSAAQAADFLAIMLARTAR
jgi:dienelactone hydrolase